MKHTLEIQVIQNEKFSSFLTLISFLLYHDLVINPLLDLCFVESSVVLELPDYHESSTFGVFLKYFFLHPNLVAYLR